MCRLPVSFDNPDSLFKSRTHLIHSIGSHSCACINKVIYFYLLYTQDAVRFGASYVKFIKSVLISDG